MLTLWRRKFCNNKVLPQWPLKVILIQINIFYLQYVFGLMPNQLKTLQECQHYEDANFYYMAYDHFYAKIILAHSFMDRFWWKFVWMPIACRHNFFQTIFMTWNVTFMLWSDLRPFDLITTLTYVLMDNFCPCF